MNENPLAVPQREISGAQTFEKYEYQYHWALCRVIDEHSKLNEYALFMEYHEDVVLSDSLDCKKANFEFNQIKNIAKPKYNVSNLTKTIKHKNSILGKLILSVSKKPYCDKLCAVNLVASCGFSFDQKDNGLMLEIIGVGDLSEKTIKEIKKALKNELGSDVIPPNLNFIIPKFNSKGQQEYTIAKIAELVDELYPDSRCNAGNIYRILIDELHRKGVVIYDYTKWDDLLDQKALTSTKVQSAILTHTSHINNDQLLADCDLLLNELGLGFLEKRNIKRSIERIYLERLGFPTGISIKVKKAIGEKLRATTPSDSKIDKVIDTVEKSLSKSLKKSIGSDLEIKASIIYEILVSDL